MTEPNAELNMRLYGMMQRLIAAVANDESHPHAELPRGVVDKQDALDAVLHIALTVDELAQSGVVPHDRATWIAALLMVTRDYIEPLPPGLDTDGVTDNLTPDLAEIVTALRHSRTS